MSSSNLVRIAYKRESSYGITPVAVKASLVVQDITYAAKKGGTPGNQITIEYVDTGTAGSETVTVNGNSIVVGIDSGVSTATQVKAAIDGNVDASALVTATISGTASDTQITAAEDSLENGAGEYDTARFTQEQYSGTPQTTESQQIRTDRMSSGQIVTGLQVEGGHSFELAKEKAIEDFMESALFNDWTSLSLKTRALTINNTAKTITAVSGDFRDEGLEVGDIIILGGFTAPGNNTKVMITSIGELVLGYAGPEGMSDGTGGTTTYRRADKLSIGAIKKSFSIEKSFLDLTTKALIYKGCIVSQMELNVEYGALISGSFSTSGNEYLAADAANEFITNGEYINDPATSNSMNGSVDMPFIATNATGTWDTGAFCLQSLNLNLNNNLTTQTCIGKAAPEDYSPGTAQIQVSLSSYLKDGNWGMLAKKLSQEPFGVGFVVSNVDGWYGFFIPAIQVSFDDPQSQGQNQEVSIEMSGTAKVGANGESALSIFRQPV